MNLNKGWHYGDNPIMGFSILLIDLIANIAVLPFIILLNVLWFTLKISVRAITLLSPYIIIGLLIYIFSTLVQYIQPGPWEGCWT